MTLHIAWRYDAQTAEITSVQRLEAKSLQIGDSLTIQGNGRCYVPLRHGRTTKNGLTPFDCSKIYWSDATPMLLEGSEVINKAEALLHTINRQLHPGGIEQKLNLSLTKNIDKSSLFLLDDFSSIVLKTQDLCHEINDCVRLKSALINLGGCAKLAPSGQSR